MSSQPTDTLTRVHPVADFAVRASARLAELASVPVWSMTPDEQRQSLVGLTRVESQIAALKLQVLAEADRSGHTARGYPAASPIAPGGARPGARGGRRPDRDGAACPG